jgi:hypothetical protein
MTAPGPVSKGTGTMPDRLTTVIVPLYCGVIGAVGAAAGPGLVVGILFAPALMVPLALLLLVGLGFADASVLRAATGRRRIGLAVVLALLVPAATGAALVAQDQFALAPYHGVPVPLVIGAVAAGISTFALSKRWALVGGLTIVLVVAASAGQAVSVTAAAPASEATTSPTAGQQSRSGTAA